MQYTDSQIARARKAYTSFLKLETVADYHLESIGRNEAEQRVAFHNKTVNAILNGNKEVEREWKIFFLREELKSDAKKIASKAKKDANKAACADILEPIKSMRKLVEFGKWLNTSGNEFRKQHFNKKYTIEAVDAFLITI